VTIKKTIDFSDVKGFEPVPDGRYRAQIEKVELNDSKSSEHQLLLWTCVLVEPEEFADGNHRQWYRSSFHPKALWRLKETLETFGLDSSALVELEVDEASNLVTNPNFDGRFCTLVIGHQEYEGKMRNSVQELIGEPLTGATAKAGKGTRDFK
jgi:hypothetical protein